MKNQNKMVRKSFFKKMDRERLSQSKGINFFKILYWLFFMAFIGATAYVFFFSGYLNILTIEFSPTKKIDSQKLSAKLETLLAEKYLNLVPKNNLLLLRENYLNNLFKQEFGLVKETKIIKKFPDKIKISVAERNPVIILENSQGRFILDNDGNGYPDNYFDSSGLDQSQLPILKEENSELAFSFDNNTGREYLEFIFRIRDKLENLLSIPLKKEIIAPMIISGDAIFETQAGWQVYFNKKIEIDKSLEMLRIVLDEKIGSDKIKDLDYIDLRIGNKVYYKFKNTEEEKPSEEKEDVSVEKSEDKDKKKK